MGRFSLATYSVRVRPKNSRDQANLDNFGGGMDLLDLVDRYLSSLNVGMSHNAESSRLLRVTHLSRNVAAREIEGVIETGEYGYEADILDSQTQERAYRRKISDAEMIPFYFLFSFPRGRDEGLLVLQRFKTFGVRKILLDDLVRFFRGLDTGFVIQISPLIPEAVVRSWIEEGRVATIKFVRFSLPSDMADHYDIADHEEIYSEIVLRAKNRGSGVLARFANSWQDLSRNRVIELNSQGFEFDTIKMEVNIGGSRKTIDLLQPGKVRAFHDISGDVELQDGHPRFTSISGKAHELLLEHFAGMGLGG